jgi:hypothetical protein
MGFCTTLNATVLGFAATIYLILGLAIIAASAATFFTPYGQIFTSIYAGSGIGAGVVIFLVSVVGYLAACKKGSCWLGIYMFFDLLIIALIIIAIVFMFRYEDVLNVAGQVNLDGTVTSGLAALGTWETTVIKDVVTNAFTACNGNTTILDASELTYHFSCINSDFETLGTTVNTCVMGGVNATNGTIMNSCYNSDNWDGGVPLVMPATAENVLPVLETSKGLYCACSDALMNDIILKYIAWFKWTGIGIAVFFVLIFLSCCYLCCCSTKNKGDESAVEFNTSQPNGWSAGSAVGNKQKGYGKSGKYGQDSAYIAKP